VAPATTTQVDRINRSQQLLNIACIAIGSAEKDRRTDSRARSTTAHQSLKLRELELTASCSQINHSQKGASLFCKSISPGALTHLPCNLGWIKIAEQLASVLPASECEYHCLQQTAFRSSAGRRAYRIATAEVGAIDTTIRRQWDFNSIARGASNFVQLYVQSEVAQYSRKASCCMNTSRLRIWLRPVRR